MGSYRNVGKQVLHVEEGMVPVETHIADAGDNEMAHFLATAANAYREPLTKEEQLELADCYQKAEPGEPKFTLLARDPLAAHLVALWAALRKGDTASAVVIFADAVADPGYNYRAKSIEGDSADKLKSACDISREMLEWRTGKGLEAFDVHNVA